MPIAAIDLDGLEQYVVIHYKDNTGRTYKTEIRTIKSNGILMDQNVKRVVPNSDIDGELFKTKGGKIAKGNVLVFEIYNEGAKNEQLRLVKFGAKDNTLSKDEKQAFREGEAVLEEETVDIEQLQYGTTDEVLYASKDFFNASTETYLTTKLYNKAVVYQIIRF
jgi:hypothetical protein